MRKHTLISAALIGTFTLGPLAGCSNLPGNAKEQGAVIGGVGGALAGGGLAKGRRGLGALVGGVLGAGGGYLIGAQKDKVDAKRRDEAIAANRRAEQNPAKPESVDKAQTADLNDDGNLDLVVTCDRNRIEVELNGEKVTRMDLDEWTRPNLRPDGTRHKFDIAYKDHPRKGYIGLQDHGSPCWFKNIKLRPLK